MQHKGDTEAQEKVKERRHLTQTKESLFVALTAKCNQVFDSYLLISFSDCFYSGLFRIYRLIKV